MQAFTAVGEVSMVKLFLPGFAGTIIKESQMPIEEQHHLLPSETRPPRLHGLPKIHKTDNPLGPIVSTCGSPTYELARYLQPYIGKTSSYFCLSTTYFLWNGDFYEQKNGAAVGSPLSPVIANLFMEAFEEEAIRGSEK
ncbi:hypothetical protein NQ318_007159 [Aromia moschata]|uniref:Uncharacterized protein n=1 Tax=Aromia moschata TaxID=1265417 RepID=A0AAV8XQ22_9CUCU|nr:hypothetical protein NQ318_007159 [Aromia moschata]